MEPTDFVDGRINYPEVEAEIFDYLCRFPVTDLTFDLFSRAQAIQQLRARVDAERLPVRTRIDTRPATQSLNWQMAEIFKTAAILDLVRAPQHDLASSELEHLIRKGVWVGAPTTGPVQTDDVADAMINATYTLLVDNHVQLFDRLRALRVRGSQAGGIPVITAPGQPTAEPSADQQIKRDNLTTSHAPLPSAAPATASGDPRATTADEDDLWRRQPQTNAAIRSRFRGIRSQGALERLSRQHLRSFVPAPRGRGRRETWKKTSAEP